MLNAGAGKSTTLGMLTGLIDPSAGDATVFDKSILNDLDEIRSMMGICLQDDVLFDELTALEHLQLYGGETHVMLVAPRSVIGLSFTLFYRQV
jgi:ATP-binding cassette subfamily A (ABC1) protein 3